MHRLRRIIERHFHGARAGMLDGIGNRFLRDAQQIVLDVGRESLGLFLELQLQANVLGFGDLARGLLDGRGQA